MQQIQKRTHVRDVIVPSDDNELVRRALTRDDNAFRAIMQKYNQRLYRIAHGILRNDSEAEDVVQEAYQDQASPRPVARPRAIGQTNRACRGRLM